MAGLTPGEARVMDLWDAGHSVRAIALHTGGHHDRVKAIVSTYHDDGEHQRSGNAMARGSAKLAAAINQARAA